MLKQLFDKMHTIQEESETIKTYNLEGFIVTIGSDDTICRLSPENKLKTAKVREFYEWDGYYRKPTSPIPGRIICNLDEQIIESDGEKFQSDNKYFLTERSARLYLVKQDFQKRVDEIRNEVYFIQLVTPKSGFVLYTNSTHRPRGEFDHDFVERTMATIADLHADGIEYHMRITNLGDKVEMNVTTALRKLYAFRADVNELFAQFKEDEKALYSLEIQKQFDYIALIEFFESLDK